MATFQDILKKAFDATGDYETSLNKAFSMFNKPTMVTMNNQEYAILTQPRVYKNSIDPSVKDFKYSELSFSLFNTHDANTTSVGGGYNSWASTSIPKTLIDQHKDMYDYLMNMNTIDIKGSLNDDDMDSIYEKISKAKKNKTHKIIDYSGEGYNNAIDFLNNRAQTNVSTSSPGSTVNVSNTASTPIDNLNKILNKSNPGKRMWINRNFVFGDNYINNEDFNRTVTEFYTNTENAGNLLEKMAKFSDLDYNIDDFKVYENMFDAYKRATGQTTKEVQQQIINQFKEWKVAPEEVQKHFRWIKEGAEKSGWQGSYEHLDYSSFNIDYSTKTRKKPKLKNADKSYRPDVIMNGNNIEFDSIYNYSTPKKVKTQTGNTQTNNVHTSSTSNTPTKTFKDWRDQYVNSGLWTVGQGEDGSLGRVKMDMSKGSKTPGYSNTDDIQLMNSWAMATDQEIDDYIERISKEGYGEDDLKKIKNMIYDERNVARHVSVDDWLKKGNVRQNHTDAYRHFRYNGKEYYATGKGTTGFWNPNNLESPVFMTVLDAETGQTVDFGKNFFNPDSPDPSSDYDYFYKIINDVEDLGYVSLNDMKDHINKNIEKNKNNVEVNTQQTQTHTQQQQQQQQQRRKINQNDPASWTDDDIKYMADDDPDTIDFLKKKRDQARQQQQQQQRQQQQQTRKDRTNTDKPQTRTRTSRRNDTGPKYDYSTYVNRSVINIDESTARSTMDISDPFVIKQTIKDANGNTRDIIHRRKSRWGDETVLESDITWNADGVYDNINKTYSGKDISPIEWKDAAYWSDDYILGRAGDDEKLLNSMLNARDRKLEAQRRYEESRVETNAEDIESAWEDDWEPDPNWEPDPEYDVDVPQNNNGQNIFNNGDPADWTDEMIREMADGDYDVYQDLISQRKAAQASRPDMNDPMNWSDDYIDKVSEGDPHYYKNMIDKRDAARKNYRQKRKGVYKKYGKNFEPEEISKKQKTKIQQPKTNKEKKNRKKQNEKNRKNKKLEDRWKAQGYDPDEKRRANFEANQERKIEKAQQAAEAQTTTETPETPKTEPPKYTNYGPRVQTEPEGPKTAPGPWINPPIIEDAIPTGDPTMLDPMNIAKNLNKVDVPTPGSMVAQIDEIRTKGKVDMPSRWGKLGKLDMIMTGVNVLGAIGDYKAERRKGKGVISSAVKSAANFAIGEALGFWGTVGVGLVKAVPGTVIKGADMLYKENRRMNSAARQQLFGDAQFMDTQQLATMRQSGMEMAKMANYNLQQTLMGNEATYLHR